MVERKTHKDIIDGWHPYSEEEKKVYTRLGYWNNLTLTDLLERNAQNVPDKLAFSDGKVELTWGQVLPRAKRMGIHLHRLGINYGDFVVLSTLNTIHAMDLLFGLNMIGAAPVMCLPRHRRLELEHHINLHKAKGVAVPFGQKFDFVGMLNDFKEDYQHLKVLLTSADEAPDGWVSIGELAKWEIEKEYPEDFLDQFRPVPDDICASHLSGGTTGVPKGIPRTYNDQIFQWDYNGRNLAFTDDSVALVGMPVLHNAAMVMLYGPAIFRGATTILCPSPRIEDAFKMIEKYKVTHHLMIPIQMTYWIEAKKELRAKYDLSSLRLVSGAAEKVRPELARWFIKEHQVNFVNIFGMSEGPMITTRWDNSIDIATETIGQPIVHDPLVKFKLVDDDNITVAQGEIGEMVSKGPLTFKGYFRVPEENKKAFDDQGFFHSGDLMRIREDGRYVVEGRKKDMIKRAGENVYPPVIEDRIAQFEKVAYCAVVGMPDLKLGEKLCAFIQPIKGTTLSFDDIIDHLKNLGVATYELPERIEFVNGWPLSPIDKIDKRKLRAFITVKALKEGLIVKQTADDYLKTDKFTSDDIIDGKVIIDFTGTPR